MSEDSKNTEIMQDLSKPSTPMEYLRLFFTGFAMGASDIVPGVSGGTMAFILGVYETLLNAIKSFNFTAIKMALGLFSSASEDEEKPTIMGIVDYLHLRFLIALGLGLLIAVALLSSLLENWLETQPTYLFAFFAGLILASVVAIGLKVKWTLISGISLIVGVVIAFLITNPELGTLSDTMGHGSLALLISGMIAICAMILPGISGSFILLILGQYDFILGAVHDRDIVSLIYVAAGAGIGILAFSRILSWLLKRYESPTIALLVGFMLGSMRLIVFRMTHLDTSAGEGLPAYTLLEVSAAQWGIGFGFAIFGFLLVTLLDHMQTRNNPFFRIFMGNKAATPVTES
ncbi:MAG: DUF368 domain-containing protein [Anaerolineae bacterium]|nr:DUF368 domain-containing protein [Anaerolineae bacterium]